MKKSQTIFAVIACFSLASEGFGAVTLTSSSIQSAIDSASAGAVIDLPAGTATVSVSINKPITLRGGQNGTTTLSASQISVGGSTSGWRITGIMFTNCIGDTIHINDTYGVVDSCTFANSSGTKEIIHVYGHATSWATDSSYGTADNVYIENCTFTGGTGGSSQSVQGNYNARFVVRYCTSTGYKIDVHGIWSNGSPNNYCSWSSPTDPKYISDAHSARHYEIYKNSVSSSDFYGIEIRGGTGYAWGNTMSGNNSRYPMPYIKEYCYMNSDGNCCGSTRRGASSYPYRDQLGRGKNQTLEPSYYWLNKIGSNIVPFRTDNDWDATGYFDHNRDYYQQLTVNGTEPGSAASFNGSSGVGVGTKAQMLAITGSKAGVGFWVTDEADWDATNSGPDGQLYAWNGSTWVLKYTPYSYPHPLRTGGAIVTTPVDPSALGATPSS